MCIDIEGNQLRFVEGTYLAGKNALQIINYGTITLENKEVTYDQSRYVKSSSEFIQKILKKQNIKTKDVFMNINDPQAVYRVIKLPYMSNKDLAMHLKMEIHQYLLVDTKANIFDYKVLDEIVESDKRMLNVLIVALPESAFMEYVNILQNAGLRVRVVDVYPNCISRLLGEKRTDNVAIIDINKNASDFLIFKSGKLYIHTKILNDKYDSNLVQKGESFIDIINQDSDFLNYISEVIEQVKSYIKFFSTRQFDQNLEKLYIIGNISLLDSIDEYFSQVLSIDFSTNLLENIDNLRIQFDSFTCEENKRIILYSNCISLLYFPWC